MGLLRRSKSISIEVGAKLHRPKDTPHLQQRMKAWKPVQTAKTSIQACLLLGILFIALGVFLLVTTSHVKEFRFDYTRCHEIEEQDRFEVMPSEEIEARLPKWSDNLPATQWKRSSQVLAFDGVSRNYTTCTIEFALPVDLEPPVLFYYSLGNFKQNHRKYLTSRDNEQLKGTPVSAESLDDSCKPVTRAGIASGGQRRIIYPCGSIANSIFNDTFMNPLKLAGGSNGASSASHSWYNMSRSGIASPSDRALYGPTTYEIPKAADKEGSVIVPPPNWSERYPNGYHSGNMFNPAEDEAFMVWMRTAASKRFAKLAMRNDNQTMEAGVYRFEIFTHFPAHLSQGSKSIIITNDGPPSRSNFLDKAYLAAGGISMLVVALSAVTLAVPQRSLKDHKYLH
ncbi:Cell division control protein 50 [Paramyrothecium foliicola]|nr:Cell division control protein 50 [Paramyrothecium foliicola]